MLSAVSLMFAVPLKQSVDLRVASSAGEVVSVSSTLQNLLSGRGAGFHPRSRLQTAVNELNTRLWIVEEI